MGLQASIGSSRQEYDNLFHKNVVKVLLLAVFWNLIQRLTAAINCPVKL